MGLLYALHFCHRVKTRTSGRDVCRRQPGFEHNNDILSVNLITVTAFGMLYRPRIRYCSRLALLV